MEVVTWEIEQLGYNPWETTTWENVIGKVPNIKYTVIQFKRTNKKITIIFEGSTSKYQKGWRGCRNLWEEGGGLKKKVGVYRKLK